MNHQLQFIILVNTIVILFWLGTVVYREFLVHHDIAFLRNNYFTMSSYKCNGWCIGHFIHYMCLGFLAPDYWKFLVLQGFLFELFEMCIEKKLNYVDSKLVQDTFTNSMGVFTGVLIRKCIYNKL